MNAAVTTLTMIVVAPIAAATSLVLYRPERWGGPPTLGSILVMAFFGLLTVPLWVTYLPVIVLAPFAMRRLASWRAFSSSSYPVFIFAALLAGALGGVCILSPAIVPAASESRDLVLNWLCAGAVSGAITFLIIAFCYRAASPRTVTP